MAMKCTQCGTQQRLTVKACVLTALKKRNQSRMSLAARVMNTPAKALRRARYVAKRSATTQTQ